MLRSQLERLRADKRTTEENLSDAQLSLASLREERDTLEETCRREQQQRAERESLIGELHGEVESLRLQCAPPPRRATSPLLTVHSVDEGGDAAALAALEAQLRTARDEARRLGEENEELVLQAQVDQGKRLIANMSSGQQSLKLEMDDMTDSEVSGVEFVCLLA